MEEKNNVLTSKIYGQGYEERYYMLYKLNQDELINHAINVEIMCRQLQKRVDELETHKNIDELSKDKINEVGHEKDARSDVQRILDLISQRRECAKEGFGVSKDELIGQIEAYTDCLATIEATMKR